MQSIGGPGVALGYLHRPELTAERFVPDPFADDGEARLYRTGDLVRWRPDGNIEFLGRNDDQVKIRGFRIELGEVEATLLRHAAVRDAVAVTRGAEEGRVRLVAYVVGDFDQGTTALHAFLVERLPGHMVPAAIVVLDAVPLTANTRGYHVELHYDWPLQVLVWELPREHTFKLEAPYFAL